MPSKPIPRGYKILALSEHGYTTVGIYTSRLDGFMGADMPYLGPNPRDPTTGEEIVIELNPTSRAGFWLCMTLPLPSMQFILFCDNYFSNIPLFLALMCHKMAACGTVRPNLAKYYPPELKVKKKQVIMEKWGNMAGAIVCGILAVIWQDKALVRFLTTAYNMSSQNPNNFMERHRKRPRLLKNNKRFQDMVIAT